MLEKSKAEGKNVSESLLKKFLTPRNGCYKATKPANVCFSLLVSKTLMKNRNKLLEQHYPYFIRIFILLLKLFIVSISLV